MKKKLIFITEALWIGGIETALVNLLNRLDYDRYDVTCLILRDCQDMACRITPKCRLIVSDRQHPATFPDAYRYNRMYDLMEEPQHASKLRRWIWHILRMLLRAPEARRYAAYVKKQLNGEHFDTAVIYSDRTAETTARAVSADRFLMFYHHGAMRREYHDTYGYKNADKIVVVSEKLSEKLRMYRPQYKDKITAINNLIDAADVYEKSLETPETVLSKDRFNIVSCGRLASAKGMDIAIDACARLVQDGYTDIRWWIVGGGPEEAALRAQIHALGMENYVTLLGMQSNPYPILRQADLFVQSSRIEAFGLTITEAQALGVPVLSTKTDGGTELIRDEETGLLCDISAEAIEDGVRRLLRDKALYDRIREGTAGIDFESRNAHVMQRLYEELKRP